MLGSNVPRMMTSTLPRVEGIAVGRAELHVHPVSGAGRLASCPRPRSSPRSPRRIPRSARSPCADGGPLGRCPASRAARRRSARASAWSAAPSLRWKRSGSVSPPRSWRQPNPRLPSIARAQSSRKAGMGRARATVFLIGLGATWNAGNVGPFVTQIASEFDVDAGPGGPDVRARSSASGIAAAGYAGSWISERLSVIDGLRLCCAVCFAGNRPDGGQPWTSRIALAARDADGVRPRAWPSSSAASTRATRAAPKLVGLFGVGHHAGDRLRARASAG